ncbi:polysaccharide biosynthesis C-terminal domain-containing protein [Maribacter sp. LLG6340-A2]|uniref:oligosaccharide flippase family protein n=1 Tax=Maribacter sp. LLG6340-A2 TaxID=3160834 RepID=UPI0038647CAC
MLKDIFKNKNRNLLIFTQGLTALIALITGKLIASYIKPEEFGVYSLQWATVIFFSSILITPFTQYVKSTENTILPYIGTKYYVWTIVLLMVISVFSVSIFLNYYNNNLNLILFFILLVFIPVNVFSGVLSNHFNVIGKIAEYCYLGIIKALGGVLFLAAYLYFESNWFSDSQLLWMTQVLSMFIGILFFGHKYPFIKSVREVAYKTYLKKYFKFSLPLIIMAFWAWINNYFDRYAIEYFMTVKDVGLYNASYSLGSKLFLTLSPIFAVLLSPSVFKKNKIDVKKKITQKYALLYIIASIPILIIVYFFSEELGSLLLSNQYKEGFFVIFWTALTFFIFTLTQLVELIFYSEKKTSIILKGNLIGALINITLNIILIPKLNLIGACIASLVGFIFYFTYIASQFFNINLIKT